MRLPKREVHERQRFDETGLYTAPAWANFDDTVIAGSAAGTVYTTMHLRPSPPRIDALSGSSATGEMLLILGANFADTAWVMFPLLGGTSLPATVVSAGELSVVVPNGATTGSLRVENPDGRP